MKVLTLLGLLALGVYDSAAQSGPGWDTEFLPPGPSSVSALAVAGSRIIVSGDRGLEEWIEADERWRRVTGFQHQEIRHLSAIGDSIVVVGGDFLRLDGTRNLALWDLRTDIWTTPDSVGSAPAVATDIRDDGVLVVGFQLKGGDRAVSELALWNPATGWWARIPGEVSGTLQDVLADGQEIFTASVWRDSFSEVKRWDGVSWVRVGHSNSIMSSLAMSPSKTLYVGGCMGEVWIPYGGYRHTESNLKWVRNVAKWHEGKWSSPDDVGSTAECASDVAIVGETELLVALEPKKLEYRSVHERAYNWQPPSPSPPSRILSREGGEWSEILTNVSGSIRKIESRGDFIVMAGSLTTVQDLAVSGVASYNRVAGTNKAYINSRQSGLNGVPSALHAGPDGSLYVAGEFTFAGIQAADGVARWDGSSWNPLGSGLGAANGFEIYDIASTDTHVFFAGTFERAGPHSANGLAAWDIQRQQWVDLGAHPEGVTALSASGERLIAAAKDGIFSFSGTSWLHAGTPNGLVRDLYVGGNGTVYAAGDFTRVSAWDSRDVEAVGVAAFQQDTWVGMGGGISGAQYVVPFPEDGGWTSSGQQILVAGSLTAPRRVANLALWDPRAETWDLVPGGLETPDSGCVARMTGVVVRGDEVFIGGVPETCQSRTWSGTGLIRRWDGASWNSIGSDQPSPGVTSMSLAFDGVFVTGDFPGHVARFDPATGTSTAVSIPDFGQGSGLQVYPNPTPGGAVQIEIDALPGASVRFEIFDAVGRRVADFAPLRPGDGRHAFTWDPGGIAPGVYFVRASHAGRVTSRALVVLRR